MARKGDCHSRQVPKTHGGPPPRGHQPAEADPTHQVARPRGPGRQRRSRFAGPRGARGWLARSAGSSPGQSACARPGTQRPGLHEAAARPRRSPAALRPPSPQTAAAALAPSLQVPRARRIPTGPKGSALIAISAHQTQTPTATDTHRHRDVKERTLLRTRSYTADDAIPGTRRDGRGLSDLCPAPPTSGPSAIPRASSLSPPPPTPAPPPARGQLTRLRIPAHAQTAEPHSSRENWKSRCWGVPTNWSSGRACCPRVSG